MNDLEKSKIELEVLQEVLHQLDMLDYDTFIEWLNHNYSDLTDYVLRSETVFTKSKEYYEILAQMEQKEYTNKQLNLISVSSDSVTFVFNQDDICYQFEVPNDGGDYIHGMTIKELLNHGEPSEFEYGIYKKGVNEIGEGYFLVPKSKIIYKDCELTE